MNGGRTKTKIAILGGGVGSLAAAFDLTENDPNNDLYDITIYQVGWRLGGKAAVGWTCTKFPTPTFETQQVQLEHGLHVWAGFYDNAFDLLQRCYAGHENAPFDSYLDAFTPVNRCWVMDRGTGHWAPWELDAPPNRRMPGISRQPPSPRALWISLLIYVSRATRDKRLTTYVESVHGAASFQLSSTAALFARKAQTIANSKAVAALGIGPRQRARLLTLVDFASERLQEPYFEAGLVQSAGDPRELSEDVRRLAIMINIGLALLLGMLDAQALVQGFDSLDDYEWSQWMSDYGAWGMSLRSGLVRGFYDYIFGYTADGERAVAAGTSTRAFLRLVLAYKGSIFYKLNVTMGEFLIAPLYELLVKRKVKFRFFSRVDRLYLSSDKKNIDRIDIGVQARLKDPSEPYRPLIDTPDGRFRTWPARPDYDQLQDGDEICAKLKQDQQDLESPWNSWDVVATEPLTRENGDFDKVILGIGLGALKYLCKDLCDEPSLRWADMVSHVRTCPTLATQLWVKKPATDLGWPAKDTVVTAFATPLNTWGDNSQLIDQEDWSAACKPASLGYLVGNLFPDDEPPPPNTSDPFPVNQLQSAKASVDNWIAASLPVLWTGFQRADLARDPYVRVNVNLSDRYVQSVPASLEKRLRPDGSGLDNLFLAGDWVRIGINAGCIEQAVLGGRAAARAITGVDMNGSYDDDRNWLGDGPLSPALAALLSNLPDVTKLALAGAGSLDACCIVDYLPPDSVKNFLPPGLSLHLPTHPPEKLPIVLLFSEQKNVRPGFLPFGGIRYLEFAIVIHNVFNDDQNSDYNGPYVYMPRILLNSFAPVAIGATAYGFKKRMARMRRVEDSFQIRNDDGEISARFENASLLGQIGDFPQLGLLRSILDQPIISETAEGGWICSYLDYHLDRASFQSLKGFCAMNQGFYQKQITFKGVPGPGNPDTEIARLVFPPLGFRMVANWDITLPMRAGEHDGLLPTPKRLHAAAMTNRLLSRFRGRR